MAKALGDSWGDFTDASMAEVVYEEVMKGEYCWVKGLNWMRWNGRRWKPCTDVTVRELVRLYVRDLLAREAKNGADSDDLKTLTGLLARNRIAAIVDLARGPAQLETASFDANPDILNAVNGVVDLRTGKVSPHDPLLMCTKIAKASYVPTATHPDWEKALAAIPEGSRHWLQVRLGQAITGYPPPDDLLPILQGRGENGKSTVVNAIIKAIGDYYTLVSDRVILATPGTHPTELMELRGTRLALIEETPEARRLHVARLKKIIGTAEIEARHVHQDSVTFSATHSMFVTTNYRPMVEETDHGTWRRLALVPFPYRFVKPPGTVDPTRNEMRGEEGLRERLLEGKDGRHRAVLKWLVDGAMEWYAAGRVMPQMPQMVVDTTREWRRSSDLVVEYWEEHLLSSDRGHVLARELFEHFNDWLKVRGHQPWSDKMFRSRFGDHEETARHHVEPPTRSMRKAPGLSRRPDRSSDMPVPAVYKAWRGLRFRQNTD